jgi:hypothetical protein
MSRSFRLWTDCVFRFAFCCFVFCLMSIDNLNQFSRTKCLVAARQSSQIKHTNGCSCYSRSVVECKVISFCFLFYFANACCAYSCDCSGAAAASVVHEAWDIAARVPSNARSRSNYSHASVPARDGIVFESSSSTASHFTTAHGSHENDYRIDRTRDLGEGMERLRLCVSLLKKQVQVCDPKPSRHVVF